MSNMPKQKSMLKWFLETSKSYMGYGKSTSKLNFWIRFPKAYIRFRWFNLRDKYNF